MFDDLSLADLTALRTRLRDALVKLVAGEKTAEIRYADGSRKCHPASETGARALITEVQTAIDKLEGRSGGALFPMAG